MADNTDQSIFDMPVHVYLRNLAERLMRIPVSFGIDGGDVDRLDDIAKETTPRKPEDRRYQDVDLGYTLFCTRRGVTRDPMGWLSTSQRDKDTYAREAVEFLKQLGVQAP